MATPLLEARDLTVCYGPIMALSDVSISVHEGRLTLILGPNGAGKTSLVTALAGLTKVTRGGVRLEGSDLGKLPASSRVRRGVALVPEGRGTLRGLSVEDNLYLGWRSAAPSRRGQLGQAVEEMFSIFPRLGERRKQDCGTLSGGEMQMLAIARALLARPKVLMLDEPSLGLAPQAVAVMYEVLGQLSRSGLAMILVEQKAVPLDVVPETTVVLGHGQVMWRGEGRRPTEDQLAALYLGSGVAT